MTAVEPAGSSPAATSPADRRRAVVLVGNPAKPYSRGLRIARALDRAGYAVEIAAVLTPDVPDLERDGPITIRRYRPSGPWASMAATFQPVAPRRRGGILGSPLRVARRLAGALRRWAFWPHTVRGWWATLERDLEPADVYHACGSLAIAPALAARARDQAEGRRSHVVYDAVDDVVEGNNFLGVPRPVRAVARPARATLGAGRGRPRDRQRRPRRQPHAALGYRPTHGHPQLAGTRPRPGRSGARPPASPPGPPAFDPDRPLPGTARAAPRDRRGGTGRARGRRRGPVPDRLRTWLRREPGARRRAGVRRPPLHAASGPPRRAGRMDGFGRRGRRPVAARVGQPARLVAEQVLGGARGRYAGRARTGARRDGAARDDA